MRLFLKHQQTVANNTNKDPNDNLNLVISSNENKKLDKVINIIAKHIFFDITSLNIKKAIIDGFNFLLEQVTRIELASSPWQGGIIAVILYLHLLCTIIISNTF